MALKRSYEVSLWTLQDEFITVLKPLNVENIGQLENKELHLKTDDGLNEYSCSIPMYIYQSTERIENPIWYNTTNGNIISNMRKIKIILNKGTDVEEVYEFLIIKVEERHEKDQLYCDITCEDLAFHELGKQGYKISLSTDVFLDEYNTWANEDGDPATEPHNTLQYWVNQFLKPVPESPLATEWYYEVQMNWDAYAEGPSRATDKVYEEEYTSSWNLRNGELVPAAVEAYKEKERLVDLQESNIFNLTQDLAQTFEVFVKYQYLYDDNYHIRGRRVIFYNNYIREEEGYIDITYPYEASSIKREIDATDVTTKMFVRPVTEDTAESGLLSIMNVDANKTKEDYLLNFDYLYSIGAITEEQHAEIPKYEAAMRAYNINLENLKSCMDVLETELTDLEATKTLLTNSIKLDQERIQDANDLLNSLDIKDLDQDGAITIDANRPSSAVLLAQENSDLYYINISEPGVLRETLHIYATYLYTNDGAREAGLYDEITGEFVDDEFGNLVKVQGLTKPDNMRSSLVYLTYKYVPRLKYEQVEKIWTVRLQADQQQLDETNDAIDDKTEELEEKTEAYEEALAAKQARIEAFNRMMGPALRESYWQPDDYKANGDNFNDSFTVSMSSLTPVEGSSGHTQFIWDDELFEDEQKSYYTILAGSGNNKIYYPCIDITGHLDYVINNYDKVSFMFYDYLSDDPDRYQFKYLRHFTLGSQAQLAFAKVGSIVKPIIIITGAETNSLYSLKNMINSRDNDTDYQPMIGIYTPSVDENYNVVGSVDENAFTVTWLNLVSSQPKQSGSGNYDITDADDFEAWIAEQSALIDNNMQIIGAVEQQVWSEVELCYPRIQIDSMLLKNDESISVHNNDTLLEKFEDYYLLTRQVEIDNGEAYQGNWFLTIKPQAMAASSVLDFYFTLSNAQTAIYLDGIQVLKENAYPKVSYTISPTLIHRDFHYTLYQKLNRIVNINDVDLKFENVQGYISDLTLDLDNPFNDKIEIKNYRNKFEDLFSSIVAQTESMKKNSYTIGLAAASFTATGALAPQVIQQSINNANLDYAFNQGTLTIDEENGIWATSNDGVVAMRGGGIFTATQKDDDGNWQWNTGILPQGINADLITTGQLDTNLIRIYAGDKLKFQMNGDGLFAYKSIFEDEDIVDLLAADAFADASQKTSITNKIESQAGLDLKQYVVHNESGLFLVAEEGSIIKTPNTNRSASPYVLKELNEDINRVEISWDGLKLRNWDNEEVFYADADTGDLTLKGTVYATGLYISGSGSGSNPPTIQEYVSGAISDAEVTYTTQYYVTTSSTTPTGNESGWTETPVTSLAADAYLWTRIKTVQGTQQPTYSSPTLLRTPGGLSALVTLSAEKQFFTKAVDGTYSPATIAITARAQNCNITGWYADDTLIPNSSGMTSYTLNAPAAGSEWTTKKIEVRTNVTGIVDIITFYILEQQSSGTSPSYVYLTNENMSFPTNSSGTTTAQTTYNTALIAQTGSSRVQPTITSIAGTAYSGSAITTNGITVTATYDSTNVQYNISVVAANNSTLGGNTSGAIPIVISAPVAQTIYIYWTKSVQGQQGNPGQSGKGITDVTEYYTVTTATTPVPTTGWQTTIPSTYNATNKYLWNYEEITYTTGSPTTTTAAIIGVYGKDGNNGNDGVSITGVVEWYKTSSNSSETRPTGSPSGGTWGDWSTSITQPSSSAIYLWNFEEIQYSSGNPTYTDPARIGNYAADGQPGSPGSPGNPGTSVAAIFLYKRATSQPSVPANTLYYYFSNNTLVSTVGGSEPSDYSGWTRTVPSGTNPCYVTCATANGTGAYDDILTSEWKTPAIAFQDGADGHDGNDGTDGYNSAMLSLYQRSATALDNSSRPSGLTYTFSTATLSGTLGNWTTTIPADNGNPCYVITAMAYSRNATDTLANTDWSTPVQMVTSGVDGTSPIVYELDISDSAISKNGSTMQPSTLVLSAVKHDGNTQSAVTSGVCYYYAISTDGTSYGNATKITNPSSFSTSGLTSAKLVRFYLYSGSDNTGTLYDWQTVPVVVEGSNGRGISSTEIKYGTSSSADTQPTNWVDASSIVLTQGTWLWVRTTINYTDSSTSSVSYSKSYVGTNGNDGTSVTITSTTKSNGVTTVTFSNGSQITIDDGDDGADAYTVILSNENHTFPGDTTAATTSSTTCTVSVYEGTTALTYGTNNDFIIGTITTTAQNGMNISNSSGTLTISVDSNLTPTSGTITVPIIINGTNITINKTITYNVSFKGQQGIQGVAGISTVPIMLYTHAASEPASNTKPSSTLYYYFSSNKLLTSTSNPSADEPSTYGTVWKRAIPADDGNPCWVIAATASGNSTYDEIESNQWSSPVKIYDDGADGKGITSVTEYYAVTSTTSEPSSGDWQTTIPSTYGATNKYLWNYEVIAYTTGNPTSTSAAIIGVYGEDGVSITSVVEWYKVSNNSTETLPTGSPSGSSWGDWSTSISQPTSSAIYLWNFEQIQYSNGTSTRTDPARIGNYAANGTPGTPGYNSATLYLYKRSSTALTNDDRPSASLTYTFSTGALTDSLSGWSRTVPSGDNPCYVITAAAIANTNTCTITQSNWSTPVKLVEDGDDGVSVTSIINIYYLQTNSTAPTQPTTSTTIVSTDIANAWTTVVPTYQTDATYWRCLKYVFSDGGISFGTQYTDGSMTQAAADAANALSVANSKNSVYYDENEPPQYKRGDIWINTTAGNNNHYMAVYDFDDPNAPVEESRWIKINTKIDGASLIVDAQSGIINIAAENGVNVSGGQLNFVSNGAINVGSSGNITIATGGTFQVESEKFDIDSNGNVSITGAITATSLKIGENGTSYSTVNALVNDSSLNTYVTGKQGVLNTMTFTAQDGLIIRADDESEYYTQTTSEGYYIKYNNTTLAGFTGKVTMLNQLKIGNIVVKPTSSGGWKWVDAEDI